MVNMTNIAPTHTMQAKCPCGIISILSMNGLVVHAGTWEPCPVENAPRPRPEPVAIRCDDCGLKVSDRQADRYDAMGVDWALCPACECSSDG